MKKVVAILLNAIFSASTLFSAFVVGDYFVRYDYYSTVLCENQEEPELQCNGKCHLALNQPDEQEQEAPLPELVEFEVQAVSNVLEVIPAVSTTYYKSDSFHFESKLHHTDFTLQLLRPPQIIVLA